MMNKADKEHSYQELRKAAHLDKAQDILETAKFLFERNFSRDSISRSYFATFHAIGSVLCSKGVFVQTDKQLLSGIKGTFIKLGIFPQEFIPRIEKFYRDCIAADEDPKAELSEQTAREYIEFAAEILVACKGYLGIK
jgi:uncharacterized protein (UPF0332 family)